MPAFIVLPDQLFAELSRSPKDTIFYFIETEWHFRRFQVHKQKLVLYSAAMQAMRERLLTKGFRVEWCGLSAYPSLNSVFKKMMKDGMRECGHYRISDRPLAAAVEAAASLVNIALSEVESPLFLTSSSWIEGQFKKEIPSFATFYTAIRRQFGVLVGPDEKPTGGMWSFASPESAQQFSHFPTLPVIEQSRYTEEAIEYVLKNFPDHPGTVDNFNYPVNHNDSLEWLEAFLEERLARYAQGNDFISTRSATVFHSGLSALLNIGLLTPRQVLESTLHYAEHNAVPLVSLEAFIRNLLGRREYQYGLYRTMRLPATKSVGKQLNEQALEFLPFATAMKRLKETGYLQPAERQLLVLFMTMLGLSQASIHDFFMTYLVAGAEWAVTASLYCQQPFLYRAQHILQASDYPVGSWVADWNSLYWNYVFQHQKKLESDPRQISVLKQLRKLPPIQLEHSQQRAKQLIRKYTSSAGGDGLL